LRQKVFFGLIIFGAGFWILRFVTFVSAQEIDTAWRAKSGPVPVINQSPVQLLFLQPVPDRAVTHPAGHGSVRLTTTVTNTLVSKESSHYQATLDMEAVRTCLDMRYGVLPRIEIGFLVPVSHYYDGFLDGFIEDVEDSFGDVRGIRTQEEADTFTYSVKKDGRAFISGAENTTGVGDVVLAAKTTIMDQERVWPALAVRASAKLPTGKRSRGFGSGEPDWGMGVLLEKDLGPLNLYWNGDITFPGEAFDDVDLSVQEFVTLMLGVEYGVTEQFSILSQLYYVTRPFEHTGVEVLDRRIYELLIGVDYRTRGALFFQGGIVEDIMDSADATADFSCFNGTFGFAP
jgi:hypothetical protein